MIIRRVDFSGELRAVVTDPAADVADILVPGANLWIDIQDYRPEELAEWIDKLGIEGLASKLCRESLDRPGFYPLKREILLVIPVLIRTGNERSVDHLGLLCRENLLLSFHQKGVMSTAEVSVLDDADSWLPEPTIAGVVASMLIDQSQACLRETVQLRKLVEVIEARMDRDPETVEADEILDLRGEVLTVASVVRDQHPCVQSLSLTEKPFFQFGDSREYVQCALANLQAADASSTWLDQRVSELRAGYQMYSQEKTNRRLGMLTILSAIFMPITLMAGIWGMNFEWMPELGMPYAYLMALGLMGTVGFVMFRYFRKSGWLES